MTDHLLAQTLKHLPKLQHLGVHDCPRVSVMTLVNLGTLRPCPRLRWLYIVRCYADASAVDAEVVLPLAHAMPLLREANIGVSGDVRQGHEQAGGAARAGQHAAALPALSARERERATGPGCVACGCVLSRGNSQQNGRMQWPTFCEPTLLLNSRPTKTCTTQRQYNHA